MVEHQPSKLAMPVRSRSPAPSISADQAMFAANYNFGRNPFGPLLGHYEIKTPQNGLEWSEQFFLVLGTEPASVAPAFFYATCEQRHRVLKHRGLVVRGPQRSRSRRLPVIPIPISEDMQWQ
jgi:hypothetical protein